MDNTKNIPNLKKQLGDEVVVVMVPFQTQRHLDPFLQFACLICSYGLSAHYLSLHTYNHDTRTRTTVINPSDLANIHFHDLQMTTTPLDLISRVKYLNISIYSGMFPCISDISSFNNAESYIFNPYCEEIMRIASFQVQYIGKSSAGDIHNTTKVMEGTNTFIDLLGIGQNKKQWAIGPLDKQPSKSVLYVSYNMLTSFSDEQIKELAMGLQLSKQKFIWLMNDPDNGDIYLGGDLNRKFEFHAGFEERLNGVGLLVRDWAPQTEIWLIHPLAETITMGVPIIAWDTHSDHPKNGFLLTEILKIGLIIREWDQKREEVVTASTIDNVVRKLMASEEGDEIRKRAKELGEAVMQSTEKGVASRMELDYFIAHITR
ncbi:hypothetical protein H5410_064276 [Solanum commersonii]|uniref:Glycosyltransferase N-terminal domain-containing protein n=1 Tax=Solanum commersonii TaxID=4109 RepID=A0A9J5VZS4_SOLCO|nr:hypothetical protein H5410_064276 [Solanum commersonii]